MLSILPEWWRGRTEQHGMGEGTRHLTTAKQVSANLHYFILSLPTTLLSVPEVLWYRFLSFLALSCINAVGSWIFLLWTWDSALSEMLSLLLLIHKLSGFPNFFIITVLIFPCMFMSFKKSHHDSSGESSWVIASDAVFNLASLLRRL